MDYNDLFMMVLDIVATNNISIAIAFIAVLAAIACTFKD